MAKPNQAASLSGRPIKESEGRFGKLLSGLSADYTLLTLDPWRLDFFFRWLIHQPQVESLPPEDFEFFIDHVSEQLGKAQPRLVKPLFAFVRKYKATARILRAEKSHGSAPLDLHEELANANKSAEAAADAVKT